MHNILPLSRVILYILLASMGFVSIVIWWWQIKVLKGNAMKNPDGSIDDWHEQKLFYGIAIADIFLACPATIAGIIMVFVSPRWGYYVLAIVSFWFVWANIMTTVTSLRFENPKITFNWFIVFPFGTLIGFAYIIWTFMYFDIIYFQ